MGKCDSDGNCGADGMYGADKKIHRRNRKLSVMDTNDLLDQFGEEALR